MIHKFVRLRGNLDAEQLAAENAKIRDWLGEKTDARWQEYLAAWP